MSKLTIVLIIIITILVSLPHTPLLKEVHASTTPNPPDWITLWVTQDLGSDIESAAFSPDGARIVAASGSTQQAVMISADNGAVIWESPYLGGYVWAVSFSPDGSRVAVGTSQGYVYILSSSDGRVMYQSVDLGLEVEWLAYSPDGSRIVAGLGGYGSNSGAVAMLTSTAQRIWVREFPFPIHAVAYSPDGSRVVAGGGNGSVVMLSSDGGLIWSSRVGVQVEGVAFSPSGGLVAVSSCYSVAVLFASSGGVLWSENIGSCAEPVAFSPDGSAVVVGTWDGEYIVFSANNGEVIHRESVDDGVEAISFSPDGDVIALGTSDNHVLAISVPLAAAIIDVPGSLDLNLSVCFYGSSSSECYPLGREGITVYAEPGNYRVVFVLEGLGADVVGDIDSLIGAPIRYIDITVSPWSHYQIDPPELTDFLGILELDSSALPGLRAHISWGSGESVVTMVKGERKSFYAVPGTYEVSLTLSELPMTSVGDVTDVHPLIKRFSIGAGRSVTIAPSIEDFLGYIILSAPQGSGVVAARISWDTGSASITVPAGDNVTVPAVPGAYSVTFSVTYWPFRNWYPDAVIGPGTRYNIFVAGPGRTVEASFLLGKRPGGLLLVTTNTAANVTVMWGDGIFSVTMAPNQSIRLLAYPMVYGVFIEPVTEPDIGVPVPINWSADVEGGYITKLVISEDTLTPRLTIRGGDTDYLVVIEGPGGNASFTLARDSVVTLRTGPATYAVMFIPETLPVNVIGDASNVAPIVRTVTTFPDAPKEVDAPSLESFLGDLVIRGWSWSADAYINISWGSGFRQYTLSPRNDLTLKAVPGYYVVYVTVAEEVIGGEDPAILVAKVYRGEAVVLNLTNTSLGSVGVLVVRNNGTVPISANVTWGHGWVEFPLDPGDSKELLAVPRGYGIIYRPLYEVAGFNYSMVPVEVPPLGSLTANVGVSAGRIEVTGTSRVRLIGEGVFWEGPGSTYVLSGDYVLQIEYGGPGPDVVGPIDDYVVEVNVTVEAGGDVVVDADKEFLNSLNELVIEGPAGAVVDVEWPTGSKEVIIPADGVVRLRAVPGVTYTVTSRSGDLLHEDFEELVYGGGYVTVVYVPSGRMYLLLLAALVAGVSAPVVAVVRPRVSARLLTNEVVEGETEYVEVEVRNRGLLGKDVAVEAEVCGKRTLERELRLRGRGAEVLKVGIPWPCDEGEEIGVRVTVNGSTALDVVVPVKVLREEVVAEKIKPVVPRVVSDVIEDVRSLVTHAKQELSAGRVYEALDLLDEAVGICSGREEEPGCSMAIHLKKSIESVMSAVKSFKVVPGTTTDNVTELVVRIEPPEDVPPKPPPIRAVLGLLPRGVKAVAVRAASPLAPGKEVLLPLAVEVTEPGQYKIPVMVSWGNYRVVGRILIKAV